MRRFATSFARTGSASSALAFNVLGAVVGGLSEYLSVMVGIRGLSLLAIGYYAIALLFHWRQERPRHGLFHRLENRPARQQIRHRLGLGRVQGRLALDGVRGRLRRRAE